MKNGFLGIGLLIMLINIPVFIGIGVTWSIMHYTGVGILVGMGTVTAVTDEKPDKGDLEGNGASGLPRQMVECPYLTSTGFIEAVVDHKGYGFSGQMNCPWRIDVPI